MLGGGTRCNVKGGKIRSVCPRCKQAQYVAVSPAARHKVVRCNCGKATSYMLNHRNFARELLSGPAEIVVGNSANLKILLSDISSAGVGFVLLKGGGSRVAVNKEAILKYRAPAGSTVMRKIKIKNKTGTKVGAEFIDALSKLAKTY